MKSNSFWRSVVNPFTRIAGWQALIAGLVVMGLTGLTGTLSGVVFDGALDAHIAPGTTCAVSFACIGVAILSVVLSMLLAALATSRDFRLIDILGTMALARAPMLLVAVAAFFAPTPDPTALLANPASFLTVGNIVFLLICMVSVIWYIALMYNAMKVSCNIRGAKLVVSFVLAVLLAEVLSKVLLHWIFAK